MKNTLAFIPARGGSKGIPNKNIFPLNGNPLIYYTLDLVKKLDFKVIPFLSTDSIDIKRYYESQGFLTDYIRPENLASDTSSTIDAVLHGLEWYEKKYNIELDSILLLQPTSPIRNPIEVSNALRYFYENNLESLVSVTEMREHPFECIKFNSNNWEFLEKAEGKVTRRQDYINRYFFIDGSFYLVKKDFLYRNNAFVKQAETYLYETNLRYSIDIDILEDITVAEAILKRGTI